MDKQTVAAILYDFDKTLSPKSMQEYAFMDGVGVSSAAFWEECDRLAHQNQMDQILAYMYVMVQKSRGKMLLNREEFKKLGKSVQLFDGVKDWFRRVNAFGQKLGLQVEHYIISSGLKEIIEGTSIAGEFKEIYAAEFLYDSDGVPVWPAMAVNYTSKTQFLFRINKNVLDVNDDKGVNRFVPEDQRRVPFRNMVYVGDGFTDVPCMKLVKHYGGHSISVYQGEEPGGEVRDMLLDGRVNFIAPANYSKGGKMEQLTFAVLREIAAVSQTVGMHLDDLASMEKAE